MFKSYPSSRNRNTLNRKGSRPETFGNTARIMQKSRKQKDKSRAWFGFFCCGYGFGFSEPLGTKRRTELRRHNQRSPENLNGYSSFECLRAAKHGLAKPEPRTLWLTRPPRRARTAPAVAPVTSRKTRGDPSAGSGPRVFFCHPLS